MQVEPSFEFGEERCFTGRYSWRLKDGELRYRGDNQYANLINGRIPVTNDQIERFIAALNLLDVWRWRDDYDPDDFGMVTLDGGDWWFSAKLAGREIKAAGRNAYPSYADPRKTADACFAEERFGLLRTCLYDIFEINQYIRQAELQRKQHQQAVSESTSGQSIERTDDDSSQ